MSKSWYICLILACILAFSSVAYGWADIGHIMTAEIARRQLTNEQVKGLNKITNTLDPFFKDQDITRLPYNACFMDVIKQDTQLFDTMHYIDFPYHVSGDFEVPDPESVNGVNAIVEAANALIFKGTKSRVWSKAFSLFVLIHVVGDIHQPLHAATLFSEEFLPPIGDMGGNKYRINYTSETGMEYTQIHLLYDCVGGLWCEYMPHPVTDDFHTRMEKYATELMEEYPPSYFGVDQIEQPFTNEKELLEIVTKWALTAFEYAKDSVYDAIPLDSKLDEKQISIIRALLRKQIALSGYRMGYLLSKVNIKLNNNPADTIPPFWRVIALVGIAVAVVALIAAIVIFMKYKKERKSGNNNAINSSPEYTFIE